MELKILGSICFLEAVGTVGNIMGYHLGAGICLAGTSLLTVYTVYLGMEKHIRKYVRSVSVKFGSRIESVRNVDTFFKKGCLKNS